MDTMIVVAVVAVVLVGIVVAFVARRRPEQAPEVADCTADSAWERYCSDRAKWSPRDPQVIESFFSGPEADTVRKSIGETTERAASAPDPVVVLRQAIMDSTDRFVLAETISESGGAMGDYAPSVVEAGALRCFSMLKHQDFATDDWYTHYLRMAEMNARNVASMVRKTVEGKAASMEESLHDPLMGAMREIRTTLLHHPPRTPVRRSDKLIHKTEPALPYPSQEQIDRLIEVMSDRFDKLFSGLVYQPEGGAAPNPAAAFQIDAGILYAILAVHFRHPDKAWREIIERSLGAYREAMGDGESLLEIGRACHVAWVRNESEGPLLPALETSCRMAFDDAATGGAGPRAAAMMEDARLLVGSIREVVAKDSPGWQK
ncbi:MAG: hypothetical protein R3344_07910 [Acidobacteriota bacterium]|nr:hypothetical protein [Acidobacteriota bacterium]